MDILTISLSAISALIGTYAGTYLISKRSERKIERIRELAVKSLTLFKEYAKKKNTFKECASEFNNKYNVAEKRAILVCLFKLGIPVSSPIRTTFDLKNISFSNVQIDKDEIEDMIGQIKKGHCDHLFFMDVDKVFNDNILQRRIRDIGVKYINDVLKKSKCDIENRLIVSPPELYANFTYSEKYYLQVFEKQLASSMLFTPHGEPDIEKLDQLINEVQIGLWDNYLLWNPDAYQNMIAQKNIVTYLMSNQNNMQLTPKP